MYKVTSKFKYFIILELLLCASSLCLDSGEWGASFSEVQVERLGDIYSQANDKTLILDELYKVKRNIAAAKLKSTNSLVYFVSSVDPLKANLTRARDRIRLGNVFDFLSLIMDGEFLVNKYEFLRYLSKEIEFANEQMALSTKTSEYVDTILKNALNQAKSYDDVEKELKRIVGLNLLMTDPQINKLKFSKVNALFSRQQIESLFGSGSFVKKKEQTLEVLFTESPDESKVLIANYMKERLQAKALQERIEIVAMMMYRISQVVEIKEAALVNIKERLERYNENSKYLALNKDKAIALFDLYLDGLIGHLKKLFDLLSDSKTIKTKLEYAITKLEAIRKTPKMSSVKIKDMLTELSCDEDIECFMHSESLMAMFFDYKIADIRDGELFTKLDMCPVCESIWMHIATKDSSPVFVASSGEYEDSSIRHVVSSPLKKISFETLPEFLARRKPLPSKIAALLSPKGLSLCGIPVAKFEVARGLIKNAIEQDSEGIKQLAEELKKIGCAKIQTVSSECENIVKSRLQTIQSKGKVAVLPPLQSSTIANPSLAEKYTAEFSDGKKTLSVTRIPSNGDCGYNALGISREDLAEILRQCLKTEGPVNEFINTEMINQFSLLSENEAKFLGSRSVENIPKYIEYFIAKSASAFESDKSVCTFETVSANPLRNYLFLGEGKTTATESTQRGLGVIVASLLKHQINIATVQKGSDGEKNIVVRVESFIPEEVEGLPLLKTKRTALGVDDSLWLVIPNGAHFDMADLL